MGIIQDSLFLKPVVLSYTTLCLSSMRTTIYLLLVVYESTTGLRNSESWMIPIFLTCVVSTLHVHSQVVLLISLCYSSLRDVGTSKEDALRIYISIRSFDGWCWYTSLGYDTITQLVSPNSISDGVWAGHKQSSYLLCKHSRDSYGMSLHSYLRIPVQGFEIQLVSRVYDPTRAKPDLL